MKITQRVSFNNILIGRVTWYFKKNRGGPGRNFSGFGSGRVFHRQSFRVPGVSGNDSGRLDNLESGLFDFQKIRRGPKLEGCAFANFGNSSETEWESRHES